MACCCSLAGTAACSVCANGPNKWTFASSTTFTPAPMVTYVPERTCRMERAAYFPFWRCSECGAVNQGIQGKEAQEQPHYCPNCGAKVVE